MILTGVLMASCALENVVVSKTGVLVQVMCVTHQEETLSVKTHQHCAGTAVTGGSTTSHVTSMVMKYLMMDWWWVLVSDVLETFNIAVGHGTDGMMLTLTSTRPVWTSQTRCSPSTQPVASSTNSSCRPTDHSGAPVTMIDLQGNTVTILMVGLLNKTKTRSLTHMVVSNPASPPMMVQTVWLANIQTSSTAILQVSSNFTFIEK